MKLVPRKRGRAAGARAKYDPEVESARASLALQEQALAEARSALDAEREGRADLERALESERKQRAKLQRRLNRTERAERVRRGPAAVSTRTGVKRNGPKPNGPEPKRGKAENWAAARRLAAEGFSQREIARRLGLNRRTVARLVVADEPPRYRRRPKGSMLDPLEPVMLSALRDRPGIDAPGMTEVLRTHGYHGSVDLVRRRLRVLRAQR